MAEGVWIKLATRIMSHVSMWLRCTVPAQQQPCATPNAAIAYLAPHRLCNKSQPRHHESWRCLSGLFVRQPTGLELSLWSSTTELCFCLFFREQWRFCRIAWQVWNLTAPSCRHPVESVFFLTNVIPELPFKNQEATSASCRRTHETWLWVLLTLQGYHRCRFSRTGCHYSHEKNKEDWRLWRVF